MSEYNELVGQLEVDAIVTKSSCSSLQKRTELGVRIQRAAQAIRDLEKELISARNYWSDEWSRSKPHLYGVLGE